MTVDTAGAPTRVLYIGGEGRSGSTVLERRLGATPGACGVGELKYLFGRGVGDRELCGCGRPVVECPLWAEVGKRLVGGWDTARGKEIVAFFRTVNEPRHLGELVLGRGRLAARAQEELARLYSLIAEIAQASLIVDSSKHPGWAFLLSRTSGVDLRVVHLIRHPSGVAHSWSKPVRRPQAPPGSTGEEFIPAHRAWEVAVRWDVFNTLFHVLEARGVPTQRLRYEDYVTDPRRAVQQGLALFGLPDADPMDGAVNHGIAGNPARFASTAERVRADERWITELDEDEHRLVSAITFPVRWVYGYRADRSDYLRHVESDQPAG